MEILSSQLHLFLLKISVNLIHSFKFLKMRRILSQKENELLYRHPNSHNSSGIVI